MVSLCAYGPLIGECFEIKLRFEYYFHRFGKDDLSDDELCDITQKHGIEQLKQAEQQLADTLDDVSMKYLTHTRSYMYIRYNG